MRIASHFTNYISRTFHVCILHHHHLQRLKSSNLQQAVKEALLKVDRNNYSTNTASSYMDGPQYIGYGQIISVPCMHAHAMEEILPILLQFSQTQPNLKILDVGCGSGYLTAALGRLVDRNGPVRPLAPGKVFGIEFVPELVDLSLKIS